ncbi:MAG: transcriptional regulator [Bacteroidetes bacterium]|nr:transcriptional regulator [Bacteroidota bacterium]
MNRFPLDHPISVYTVKASSFPEGVQAAHMYLHSLVSFSTKRKYFGISHGSPEKEIIYYAAAEELEKGELEKHGLATFILEAGDYLYVDIPDFMKNISAIGQAFAALLQEPHIDPQGACVEWYLDQHTCRCMVRVTQ